MINIEDVELEDGVVILEPQTSYNKAIIGISIDSTKREQESHAWEVECPMMMLDIG